MEATKRPWKVSTVYVDSADNGKLCIFSGGEHPQPVAVVLPPPLVYTRHPDTEARAALIVRAVNCHEELVGALAFVLTSLTTQAQYLTAAEPWGKDARDINAGCQEAIRAALAKAK